MLNDAIWYFGLIQLLIGITIGGLISGFMMFGIYEFAFRRVGIKTIKRNNITKKWEIVYKHAK